MQKFQPGHTRHIGTAAYQARKQAFDRQKRTKEFNYNCLTRSPKKEVGNLFKNNNSHLRFFCVVAYFGLELLFFTLTPISEPLLNWIRIPAAAKYFAA